MAPQPIPVRWLRAMSAQTEPSGHANGCTTAFDDNLVDCDRNGARILPTMLQTHAPLDLVIIMLGANMKPFVCGCAIESPESAEDPA